MSGIRCTVLIIMKEKSMKRYNVRMLTVLGLLIALEIILSRFCSISAWNIKIGFNFIPVVIAALLYGPLTAGIAAGLADFLGAVLFPIGMYCPGFTVTAFLTGAVYGIFLYKQRNSFRIFCAVLFSQLVFSLCLNTLWISILYDSPYLPLLATRAVQCIAAGLIRFVVISILIRGVGVYIES